MGAIVREIVLDPSVCSEERVLQRLYDAWGETGWDRGIVFAVCSEEDEKSLWETCQTADNLQVQQLLQELLPHSVVRVADNGKWSQSLDKAHRMSSVDCVVSRGACSSGPRRIDPDAPTLARELAIGSNDVKRCGLATARAVGPLLLTADEIRVVDPYALRPDENTRRRFGPFLSELFRYAQQPVFRSTTRKLKCELHSKLMPDARSARAQLRTWRRYKSDWKEFQGVELVLWRDGERWCHDRWILSNLGGVKATVGLDVPPEDKPSSQSIFPLPRRDHVSHWGQTASVDRQGVDGEADVWIDSHG